MLYHLLPWILFNGVILALLILDLGYFHRSKAKEISFRSALFWTFFWIALTLFFNFFIYLWRGPGDALNFLTGYLIEELLSVDNLFVFILIFKYFQTPASSKRKVLFYGVLSAILMRAVFIALGIFLIAKFHWILYLGIFF